MCAGNKNVHYTHTIVFISDGWFFIRRHKSSSCFCEGKKLISHMSHNQYTASAFQCGKEIKRCPLMSVVFIRMADFPLDSFVCFDTRGTTELTLMSHFLPAATARWSINAVSSSSPSSPRKTIEHSGIETNELNMTLMSHMTHNDSV